MAAREIGARACGLVLLLAIPTKPRKQKRFFSAAPALLLEARVFFARPHKIGFDVGVFSGLVARKTLEFREIERGFRLRPHVAPRIRPAPVRASARFSAPVALQNASVAASMPRPRDVFARFKPPAARRPRTNNVAYVLRSIVVLDGRAGRSGVVYGAALRFLGRRSPVERRTLGIRRAIEPLL